MTTFDKKIGRDRLFESYIWNWGMQDDPFKLELPSIEAFAPFQRKDLRKLERLFYGGKVGVLTGGLGTGKTTVCEFLVASLKEENLTEPDPSKQIIPVFIHGAAYKSADELLRAIILGLEMDASKERENLFEFLRRWPQEHPERLAIIIDDLPESGADALEVGEFLRVLADIPNISILINGELKRMERFLARAPALADRIQTKIQLKPMSKKNLKEMLELRLKNAGCADYNDLLTSKGFKSLYKLSKGIPRLALKAASNAIHYASEIDVPIDARVVKKANKRSFFKRIFSFLI